jgi:hypothetical protein
MRRHSNGGHGRISKDSFGFALKPAISAEKVDSNFSTSAVEQFLVRSQITWGGLPFKMLISKKSKSLETIANPLCGGELPNQAVV